MENFPVNATELIPHRGNMLLMPELTYASSEKAEAFFAVPAEGLMVRRDSTLIPVALIEMSAQLTAAWIGWEKRNGRNMSNSGYLVGIKDFAVNGKVMSGDKLKIRVTKKETIGPVIVIDSKVFANDREAASGELKIWNNPPDLPEKKTPETESGSGELNIHGTEFFEKRADIDREIVRSIIGFNADDENSVAAKLVFNESFPGFDGHFPGKPVVPGILLLETVMLIKELHLKSELALTGISQVKFSLPVLPRQPVELHVSAVRESDGLKIKGKALLNDKRAVFSELFAEKAIGG